MTEGGIIDWARGDTLGLDLPAHLQALSAGGPAFLTRAFRATGALAGDNRVTEITRLEEWPYGGTGVKALLSVAYERDDPGLPCDLFVKLSRNFNERARDRARFQMASEVRLANLSRSPAFPIAAPRCLYADFNHASGAGLLITERIPYGQGAVEPHHHKCMDQVLPEPLEHYRVLISTLARLAGAHRSGRLGDVVERDFPLDLEKAAIDRFSPYDEEQLALRVDRLADFIARYPHLAPPRLADPAFLAGFRADAPLFVAQQDAIARAYHSRPDMIALCHWNANIDNAWFWREPDGTLKCGLIDWGNVGQMPVTRAIWGCLGACELDLLDQHLDELLDLFIAEYAQAGGPTLDRRELEQHLDLSQLMTLPGRMIAPRAILSEVPDPALAADRHDPLFSVNETARVQLKVLLNFLDLWRRRDLGRQLREGVWPGPA